LKSRVTLKDVVEMSGFSIATVSRALGDTDYPVSRETREKVQQVAKELGYIPNLLSRSLITKNTRDIGLVLPNISNIYYLQLVNGIITAARQLDYTVTIMNSQRSINTERYNLTRLLQKRIDGALVIPISYQNNTLSELMKYGVKVVVLDQDCNIECSKVLFDFTQGMYMSTEHLIELGHTEIAFFSAPFRQKSRSQQLIGYKQALRSYNIPFQESYIFVAEEENDLGESYEYENGINLAKEMLLRFDDKKRPSAIVCINDMTAIGAIHQFQNSGVRIPEDISVVGFDNTIISKTSNPAITTIDQCIYQMGSLAIQLLTNNIAGSGDNDATSVLLQPSLVIRGSTSPLSK